MTGNTKKVRAVFLAALMIFSVFAGTVAFSGSVAAQPTYDGNAVHYETQSNDNSGQPVIEVPFDTPGEANLSAASLDKSNFTVLDDGDNTSAINSFRMRNATVILRLDRTIASNDLEVSISDEVAAVGGATIDNPGDKAVVFAGQTIEHDTAFNVSSNGGADSQASLNGNITAYQGVTLAINASNVTNQQRNISNGGPHGGIPVTVEGEDNNYFQEGNTGTNSTVFTFDTSDRELGKYRIFLNSTDNSANRTFVNVRDLGLDISVDETNVTTDDTIETTASAVAGNRQVTGRLLDSNGDSINASTDSLGGQGEADFDFVTSTADEGSELDTGAYTVEITDNATGVVVESTEITVTQADDESASFAESVITNERGDILEATIEMTETSEATIGFGSADDGAVANATVEDDDGDDQVTVLINTFNFQTSTTDDIYSLPDDSDDNILEQEQNNVPTSTPGTNELDDLIDSGDYDFEVEAGDQGVSTGVTDSDDVATVTLEERSTDAFRSWTGSSGELSSLSDLEAVNEAIAEGTITQSDEVAVGDLVVHQLVASGLEGALRARTNEEVTDRFATLNSTSGPFNLTIEEADPGANQNARELALFQSGNNNNLTVIADGQNDTYFIIVDTGEAPFQNSNADIPADDDTQLEANFTVINNDAGFDFVDNSSLDDDENEEIFVEYGANEPEVTIQEPFNVSQASGQTISATTNIAPGTEINLRVRSQDGVSPSFLKTSTPEVQPDGSFSATFDFSSQNVGDEYDIVVQNTLLASDEEEEGQVLGAVATDTATPESDTDTATPEPDTATPEPDTATPEPDTATPEPDTATPEPDTDTPTSTPTSTPGFGVVVALTALLAAALLAVRRD